MGKILKHKSVRVAFGLILLFGCLPTISQAINDSVIRPTNTTANRLVATDSTKKLVSVSSLCAWVGGAAGRITCSDDGDGTLTLDTLSASCLQTETIADSGDANPATATLTPTQYCAQNLFLITCSDADGCAVTWSEASATDGDWVVVRNISANEVTMAYSSGVFEHECGAAQDLTLNQHQSVTMSYGDTRWAVFSNESEYVCAGTFVGGNVTSGADPGHTHTGASLSGIDISDDTNLAVSSPITLTDDTVGLDFSTNNTWTGTFTHQNASDSATAFRVLDALGSSVLNIDTSTHKITVDGDFAGGVNSLATFSTTVSAAGNNLSAITASNTTTGYNSSNLTSFNSTISAPTGSGHTLTAFKGSVSHTAIGVSTLYGLRITTDSRTGDNVWGINISDSGSSAAKNYFGDGPNGFRNASPVHMLDVINNASTVNGLKIKAASSQSANIIETTDSSSNIIFHVEPDGETVIPQDSKSFKVGAGLDAEWYYDGADLYINSDLVGSGSTKIGDATNNCEIKPDGEVNLNGTARVKLEQTERASTISLGVTAPDRETLPVGASGNVEFQTLAFDPTGVTADEEAEIDFHIPGDCDNSVNVEFHLMWVPDPNWAVDGDDDYHWCLEYIVKTETASRTTGTPTTICESVTPANATDFIETEFASTIDANAQEVIMGRLYLDKSESGANDDGHVRFAEIERTVNKHGEAL